MKKSSKYLVLAIFLTFFCGELIVKATSSNYFKQTLISEQPQKNQIVTFPDPILEQAIRDRLNIPKLQPLTREYLSQTFLTIAFLKSR
ncbi:MAG: hypothetical protein QNJ38_03475 [Prochloraceae cyanobacterium]|nr:hypothetical protein [Prochloraceae cyanobacterium]